MAQTALRPATHAHGAEIWRSLPGQFRDCTRVAAQKKSFRAGFGCGCTCRQRFISWGRLLDDSEGAGEGERMGAFCPWEQRVWVPIWSRCMDPIVGNMAPFEGAPWMVARARCPSWLCTNRLSARLKTRTLGECLPGACLARARRATFVLSILALAPSISPPGELPQIDPTGLQTFPPKHIA